MIDHTIPRRVSDIVHPLLGRIHPAISTIEPFSPARYLTCPGRLAIVRGLAMRRYLRSMGVRTDARRWSPGELLSELPPKIRRSAMDRAADTVVCRLLDADYSALGITDDEPARAVLAALRYVEKSGFRDRYGRNGSRSDHRKVEKYSGSMANRGDNPATIAAAIESAPVRYRSGIRVEIDRAHAHAAIVGAGQEVQVADDDSCAVVHCPGGRAYLEIRRLESTREVGVWIDTGEPTTIDPETGETVRYRFRRIGKPGGWRMVTKKSHHPTEYDPGVARIVGDDYGRGVEYAG